MRFSLDSSAQRFGDVIIGGSPLKLFRLTPGGTKLVDRIARGDDLEFAVNPSDTTSVLLDRFVDAGVLHPVVTAGLGPFTEDDVTIVVPTLGEPRHVPAGAIVVDDGSQPPVAAASVRLPANCGPAAARNAGLAVVNTPLVAFIDADVSLTPGWLSHLLPHFDDERVALVAPRVTVDATAGAISSYERHNGPLDLGPEPGRILAGTRVSYVPSAAIVCRAEAVRSVGSFDERLRAGEDVDLVWRLAEAGWRCRYEPAASVQHAARPTWAAWARQRITYGASAAPLAKRHPGALAPVRMSGWSLVSWGLGMAAHPVAGTAVGLGSAVALTRKLTDVPPAAAFRLAAMGNARAGEQIGNAVRRVWWPLLAVAAWRSRTARRVLVASAIAAKHPVRLADDVAYSVGVWKGMIVERTISPLVPEISSWPGKRQASTAR